MGEQTEDKTAFCVVVNDEEQYSIWPADKAVPAGWRSVGTAGSRADCLEHVKQVWSDMRPLGVRRSVKQERRT